MVLDFEFVKCVIVQIIFILLGRRGFPILGIIENPYGFVSFGIILIKTIDSIGLEQSNTEEVMDLTHDELDIIQDDWAHEKISGEKAIQRLAEKMGYRDIQSLLNANNSIVDEIFHTIRMDYDSQLEYNQLEQEQAGVERKYVDVSDKEDYYKE